MSQTMEQIAGKKGYLLTGVQRTINYAKKKDNTTYLEN